VPIAVGFRSEFALIQHFGFHRADFGVTTKEDYLARAKAFLETDRATNPAILECIRTDGDIVRFNQNTNEFAVVDSAGIIKTYYKPIPRRLARRGTPRIKTHGFRTNLDYFNHNCAK